MIAGTGWVGVLRPADSWGNFAGYEREPVAVGIMPLSGWVRRIKDGSIPVVGLVIYDTGEVRPAEGAEEGFASGDPYTCVDGYEPEGGWPE